MAGSSTQKKRQRELALREQRAEKAARRAERKASKDERGAAPGEDPDLVGIIPGPQPSQDQA
jgi:hypothetical protein